MARILTDYKDNPRNGHYGGMIQTGLLAGMAQGVVNLVKPHFFLASEKSEPGL